ncbi:hypothetical protein RHSIM_Rhsim02G0160500 [Rhododendron simsii]|uniref:Retrovirus-related Pol polyprotein from transposon TNT 1-94-like beta-barrel domain-containing protein n=1 Tax=Rhododendron simsii TaxID=118357 RepID=A0A834HDV1_RHOSS|nr:hypothetical protein RHSIM_Rhsim02G0160500 [Rhododendron simsii]
MEDLLYCKDLHGLVEGDMTKPINKKCGDWTTLNRKASLLICQWIDDSVFHHVSTETSAYDLRKKLESLYDSKSVTNKAFLFKKLFSTQESENFVVTVSNSVSNGVVLMSQVTSRLLNEEMRRKSTGSYSEALVKPRGRSRVATTPHPNRDQSHESSRGRSPSKQDIECHYCKKKGQMKRKCLKLKFNEENHVKQCEKKQDNTTVVSFDGELMVVCEESCVNLETLGGCVRMGNEGLSKFVRMENICLKTSVVCKLLLKDVRHVSDIRLNLISTGKLDDEGYNNHFGQIIKDFDNDKQPEEIASDLIDLEPIPSALAYGKNEEDVQPPFEVSENVDVPSEVELENEEEQSIQEPRPQPEIR